MTNFTQTSLVCAVTTVMLSIGACSIEQMTSEKSPEDIKTTTLFLSDGTTLGETASPSVQFDTEVGLSQNIQIAKASRLPVNITEFYQRPTIAKRTQPMKTTRRLERRKGECRLSALMLILAPIQICAEFFNQAHSPQKMPSGLKSLLIIFLTTMLLIKHKTNRSL
jgi:hypothetical protein